MKKAALYARVSSDLQKKEKTIDSQIVELKRQIVAAGDVLVQEYIDDGHSGARLDRPAMNHLRADLKTNLFDVIYFLNTDRIAREVTYQTIIIAEILKHKKRVIINGKDYVHNPENKFTLTVLGAVAELERAKIIERVTRAKQHKLKNGQLMGCGNNIYGYDYHRRTLTSDPYYTINEKEAKVVRYVFETYVSKTIGMCQITRKLEDMKAPTKYGKNIWRVSLLKQMLKNEMYTGIRYFNTMRRIREYANPIHGIKHSSSKNVKRDRSEWVGIKVPTIIPKPLFDKVQERLEWNRKHYRNPRIIQLLSSLVRCGACDSSMFAYSRYYKDKRMKNPVVIHRVSYKCNYRLRVRTMHSKKTGLKLCDSKEVKSTIIEDHVFNLIREVLINPNKLRESMDFFKRRKQANQLRFEKQLKATDQQTEKIHTAKKRLVDLYANGEMERDAYVLKNLEYDNDLNRLKVERKELLGKIPLLHKKEVIDTSIKEYCEGAKARLEKGDDFNTKRQFLLDYIQNVIYWDDEIELRGFVPVKSKAYADGESRSELGKLDFRIKGNLLRIGGVKTERRPYASTEVISRGEYDSYLATTIIK